MDRTRARRTSAEEAGASDERKRAALEALARPRFEVIRVEGAVERAAHYSPDELDGKRAPYVGERLHHIAGFHIHTLNHVESTEQWRQQVVGFKWAGSTISPW
jgi:PAS domain-containing protein